MSKVTIGITCYNARGTICRAIESAIDQNYDDTEIIIVDDCSIDGSQQEIRAYIVDNSNIKLFSLPVNCGAAAARNVIIKESTGDYIAFFDDDDVSTPDRVRVQKHYLDTFSSDNLLVACYASGMRKYPNGYSLELNAVGTQGIPPSGSILIDYLFLHQKTKGVDFGFGTPTCCLMAKKSVFESVGLFDESFRRVEDAEFAVRLAMLGGVFIGTRERLFCQYSTQSSDKSAKENLKYELMMVDKHKDYLQKVKRYSYAYLWPQLRYSHFKKDYLSFILILTKLLVTNPFCTLKHLFVTGPKRLMHERKMIKAPRI